MHDDSGVGVEHLEPDLHVEHRRQGVAPPHRRRPQHVAVEIRRRAVVVHAREVGAVLVLIDIADIEKGAEDAVHRRLR
ncbi:Uncharacterised protein [Mycobacteroides abscessus subsp. abscessus]|nr:Uncharacterised protein [Mycobacteroides abscessus subsp. abscessus]